MTNFAEAAQNQDAITFQEQLTLAINERVAAALEARKSQVAATMLEAEAGDAPDGSPAPEGSDAARIRREQKAKMAAAGNADQSVDIEPVKSEEVLDERAKMHLHIKSGAFHRWLGKSEDEPITDADIERGLKAGGHAAKMANFARNARSWHHK